MAESTFRIFLDDLRFYGRIGIGEQERIVGNEFIVSVSVRFDASGFEQENLHSSISYADIYEVVKAAMRREWILLESVAKEISERISNRWMQTEEISVRLVKDKAPIDGLVGNCGVEYFWKKS